MRKAPLSTPSMPFTALQSPSDRIKIPHYGLIEDTEVTHDNAREKSAKRQTPFVLRGASVTIISLIVPYLLGFCIAAAHLALYTYLDGKRIGIDTSLPQSWISAIALVLVNTFRLAVCFALGIAFTQLLWRRIRTTPMPLGDFDRLQRLQTDLLAMLHPEILRMVSVLSIVAVLGWLITVAMILPPGSLTVVAKTFSSETEQRVPTFNSSFTGNGTFVSAYEYMLATPFQWLYANTKQPVLATSKGVLISRDVIASTSPCGTNCTFTVSFHGPLAKCNTTTFNETIPIEFSEGQDTQYLPKFSGGWNVTGIDRSLNLESTTPGWVTPIANPGIGPCESNDPDIDLCVAVFTRPDTFFVSQHYIPAQTTDASGRVATYQRSTQKTSCKLHLGKYTLRTEYMDGKRILNVSTSEEETLEALWAVDHNKPIGRSEGDQIPINMDSTIRVINVFALFDGLVQALRGEYYDGMSLMLGGSKVETISNNPLEEYIRANQTIIADSVFNRARYNFNPNSDRMGNCVDLNPGRPAIGNCMDLDLSEDRINEALQNITLSVMYTLDWWYTTANVTRSLNYNTFSFSSRPRLIIPYAASLLLSLPFLFLGFRALQLNGAPAMDTSFLQTLVTTTGSTRLREMAAVGSEAPHDVPESVKETRIRFGYMLERNGEDVVKRSTFGLEDEVEDLNG